MLSAAQHVKLPQHTTTMLRLRSTPLAKIALQDIADAGWIGVVSTGFMALAVIIVVVRLASRESAGTGHQLINTGVRSQVPRSGAVQPQVTD